MLFRGCVDLVYPDPDSNKKNAKSIEIPLEVSSARAKTLEVPFKKVEDSHDHWCTNRIFSGLNKCCESVDDAINNSRALILIIYIWPICFTVTQAIYHICLMASIKNDTMFYGMFPVIASFLAINAVILTVKLKRRPFTECIVFLYTMIIITFIGISVLVIKDLTDQHKHLIAYTVIFVLSLGLVGIYSMLCLLMFILYFFMEFFELMIRLLTCKLSDDKKKTTLFYQTYAFDNTKPLAKSCAICLTDFADKESICLSRCQQLHVFHEKCISEWLERNPICPMCRANIDLA